MVLNEHTLSGQELTDSVGLLRTVYLKPGEQIMSIDKASPEEWNSLKSKDYGKQYNNVHSPLHYNKGHVECIDAIESMLSNEEYIGYLRGYSMK